MKKNKLHTNVHLNPLIAPTDTQAITCLPSLLDTSHFNLNYSATKTPSKGGSSRSTYRKKDFKPLYNV